MITTSFTKVQVNELIQSQIPEYIDTENPLFGDFIKQFYISQEFQGGSIDIADNLVEYKGLNFSNKKNEDFSSNIKGNVSGRDSPLEPNSPVYIIKNLVGN